MDVEHYDFGVCVGKQMCAKYRLVGYGVGEKLCCQEFVLVSKSVLVRICLVKDVEFTASWY